MHANWKSGLIAGVFFLGATQLAWSAEAPMAVVNGVKIPAMLLERSVKASVAQGQSDSPALRAALEQELIARELMVQEASRRGLDKLQETEFALQTLKQNLLIDVLVQDELNKNPITEADFKAEYERQLRVLGASNLQQYQLATIVVGSEVEARTVMASLSSGKSFESQAKAYSMDTSKERGGESAWLLPEQITPAISNVLVNLSIGSVSMAPIQVGNYWHVVKLLGKRAYQAPSFEESKNLLQAAVVQNRRTALLNKLLEAAKIKR
jgi:peptidyl-prolyl cis-trans isomerase C